MIDKIILLLALILPVAAAWIAVLRLGPAIARAKVEREMAQIRGQIVSAMVAGEIDTDNARALDAVAFCEYVIDNSHLISLSRVGANERAFARYCVRNSVKPNKADLFEINKHKKPFGKESNNNNARHKEKQRLLEASKGFNAID